jgi:hypothetical protein
LLQIWHRKRKPREIYSSAVAGGVLAWEKKSLPSGGATTYAFETYGTPIYDFVNGNGATYIRNPLLETQPAQWANFTVPVVPNPPLNTFQGQFATQPLVDPNTAQALGLTGDGAIPPGAYNAMPVAGIGLSP